MLPGLACKHVREQLVSGQPVLFVCRTEPVDEDDTGLEVYCGQEAHSPEDCVLINLDRVVAVDASVGEMLEALEEGQQAHRSAPGQPWVVEPIPPEDDQAAA